MSELTDRLRDACDRFERELISLSSVERLLAQVRATADDIDRTTNVIPMRVHDTHSVKVEAKR